MVVASTNQQFKVVNLDLLFNLSVYELDLSLKITSSKKIHLNKILAHSLIQKADRYKLVSHILKDIYLNTVPNWTISVCVGCIRHILISVGVSLKIGVY